MEPTTLTISCDADLVGAVPYLLGFHPEESVTLLTTPKAVGGRAAGPAARTDLRDAGGPRGLALLADVAEQLAAQGLGIYAAVVHTDVPLEVARHARDVVATVARVRLVDDDRVGAWVVARDGWERLPGHAPFDDRRGPRDLADLGHARAVAELVLSGHAPAADRASLGVRRTPTSPVGDLLAEGVLARLRRRPPGIGLTVRAYDDLVSRGRVAREPRAKDRELLARLLVGLERLDVRDAVLTRVVVGTELPISVLGDPGMVGFLWLGGTVDTAERRAPLEVLAQLAPDGWAAPPLAMLALLAWRRGEGARACVLADLALADRPGYSLAELVLDLQAAGLRASPEPRPARAQGSRPWAASVRPGEVAEIDERTGRSDAA